MRRTVRVSLRAGILIAALGLVVWMTGRPFIFPSLGPTAFVLATNSSDTTARQVIGGHFWGVLAGLLIYHLFAEGLIVTDFHTPLSTTGLWLAASGSLSVALTTMCMLFTRTVHAPACATTLIISLGLLSSILEGVIIMIAVSVLWAIHVVFWPVPQS